MILLVFQPRTLNKKTQCLDYILSICEMEIVSFIFDGSVCSEITEEIVGVRTTTSWQKYLVLNIYY